MLFEVVKGNSMGNVDNFIGVLNKHAGSEAIPFYTDQGFPK